VEWHKILGMTAEEARACEYLTAAGLTVERIPESDTQSCDFSAGDGEHVYLLEVKCRNDAPLKSWVYDENDDTWSRERPYGMDLKETYRKLSGTMKQIDASRQSRDDLAIVWVAIADCASRDLLRRQVVDTFFGLQPIRQPPIGRPHRAFSSAKVSASATKSWTP
jgi:hypothetical protein